MRQDRISNIDLYRGTDPFQFLFREPLWGFGAAPRRTRGRVRDGGRFTIEEEEDAYVMTAELPGVGEEDLALEVTRERLRVGVAKPQGSSEADGEESAELSPSQSEREWRLRREFSFREPLDPDSVTASIKHGLLKVRLPKQAAVSARKVPVLAT